MKRFLLSILKYAVLAGLAAGGLYYTGHLPGVPKPGAGEPTKAAGAGARAAPPPAVTVHRAKQATFRETIAVTGSLVPREEILISPEVEGLRILEIKVDEGARVEAGQTLAVLETATLEAQLAQNAAQLARTQAAIAQAHSTITSAQARMEEAEAAYNRAKPLKQSGAISDSVMDQRETAERTSRAALVSSRDALKVAEAEKAQVEAQRSEIAWRRAKTEIKAPVAGIVSRRTARVGAVATAAGDPMFRMIAAGEIELDAEVPETQLGRLKEGQSVRVVGPAGEEVDGRIRLVSPEVDRTTRQGRVRVFIGAGSTLKIGSFARGLVDAASGEGIGVPVSAVVYSDQGAQVQVVAGDRVETRMIKTGIASGGLIEIKSGVADGELVVTRAGSFLRNGDVVRPVLPDARLSEVK